jgi:putative tryptophan/tyrosine transport system substrate-binding protein
LGDADKTIPADGEETAVRRREFIALFIGSAAVGPGLQPLSMRAQTPKNLPTIGILGADAAANQGWLWANFVERLRVLGWTEGRNVAIELRWAEAHVDRYAEIAAEFVRLKVDVIVTSSTPTALAAKQATTVIPIVFTNASDPIGNGLVASLSRPGGNVTGFSTQLAETAGKRLEFLRSIVHGLRRLAILYMNDVAALREMGEARAAADKLGFESITSEIASAEDIVTSFEALKDNADGLYVCNTNLFNEIRKHIVALELGAKLPAVHDLRGWVAAGGLISYAPDSVDLFRRAAGFVDRILRGAKPGEIPVEQPTRFFLAVNLSTAMTLGLTVPPELIGVADEVIE